MWLQLYIMQFWIFTPELWVYLTILTLKHAIVTISCNSDFKTRNYNCISRNSDFFFLIIDFLKILTLKHAIVTVYHTILTFSPRIASLSNKIDFKIRNYDCISSNSEFLPQNCEFVSQFWN